MKRKSLFRDTESVEWKSFWREKANTSVIAKRVRKIVNWLYSHAINGFFGKILTAYSAEDKLFENSLIKRKLGGKTQAHSKVTRARLTMSQLFERSLILTSISELFSSLIHRKLKTYGAFFLSLGAYGTITYFIRSFVFFKGGDRNDLIVCLSLLLFSLPLLLSKETLASAVVKSRLMSSFLFKGLGLPNDYFVKTVKLPNRYSLVTFMGMVLGGLTYFISPIYYLIVASILFSASLILTYPEVGVLALLALVPMSSLTVYSSETLFGILLVTVFSYVIKLIRGKRGFHLRLMDFAVLLFATVQLFGGIVSAGGAQSFRAAAFYFALTLGYFLVVNLVRTEEWVKRSVASLLLFGIVSALIGVVQIFTGGLEASWLDTDVFSTISTRITATFDNPNVYAAYLLLVIPFSFAFLAKKKTGVPKFWHAICLILLLVCMVETWSRGAWLGVLFATVLFFLVYTRRSLPVFLLGGALIPVGSLFLSGNVAERFLSIGSASDSSSQYRISAWRGVVRMLREKWFGGIGFGEAAFSTVYPSFSYAGIESICHTHNLYLQIISETGVAGIVVFALVIILFVQNCLESVYKRRNNADSAIVIAGMAAIGAILVMGLTDYVWYNSRVFLMFWLVMGITNANIRVGEEELKRSFAAIEYSAYSVNVDLNVDNL